MMMVVVVVVVVVMMRAQRLLVGRSTYILKKLLRNTLWPMAYVTNCLKECLICEQLSIRNVS
jgi:hypothetical protein